MKKQEMGESRGGEELSVRVIPLLLAMMFLLTGCTPFKPYAVEYRVTGSAPSVSVTYENASRGTSQATGCGLPWTYSFEGYRNQFVYISAQNEGESGTVTASIYVDGKCYWTSTSSGAYVIATACGSLPSE